MKPTKKEIGQQPTPASLESDLKSVIQQLAYEQFGPSFKGQSFNLDLRCKVEPDHWRLRFDPPLAHQIRMKLAECELQSDIFRAGAVYCHSCRRSTCHHATPPTRLHIFESYDEVGVPQWIEYAQYQLNQKHESVHLLFQNKPVIIASMVYGGPLRKRMLKAFGRQSITYAILGQVMVGYFKTGKPDARDEDRVALTIQAIEINDGRGGANLKLNILGSGPDNEPWLDHFQNHRLQWVVNAIGKAQQTLKDYQAKLQIARRKQDHKGTRDLRAKVPDILKRLATALQQGVRRQKRRTQHAQERKTMERPIHNAMADLRRAAPDRLYLDTKTAAIVVHAHHGRCHIFNQNGQHITSFTISKESVAQRIRRKRWRNMTSEKIEGFLEQVKKGAPQKVKRPS